MHTSKPQEQSLGTEDPGTAAKTMLASYPILQMGQAGRGTKQANVTYVQGGAFTLVLFKGHLIQEV